MESIEKQTRRIMKQFGITANKKLGQNFLISEEVVDCIVEASEIEKEDLVIEIGPGLGTLTKKLLEKAKKVICIELDKKMIEILKQRFLAYSNLEIIEADVLKIDLKEKIKQEGIPTVKVVANLPYYITTPIMMKLLEEELELDRITVMIQKEVAKRLAAIPGSKQAGAITYTTYYYAKVKEVTSVSHSCFIPEPEVESEVITLELRKSPVVEIQDKAVFFDIIKKAFMQRRKTLVNALTQENFLEKEQTEEILEQLGLDKKVRGEALTIEQFAELARKIAKIKKD